MSEFISYLFAIFVVTPLEAEIAERLGNRRSAELIQAARSCISVEAPQLLQRAQDNWGWATANGLGVAAGLVDPLTLLPAENENCRLIAEATAANS